MTETRRLLRPPRGTRCDAHSGASYDDHGAPVLRRCANTATVTAIVPPLPFDHWLCEPCAAAMADKIARRTKPAKSAPTDA